MTASVRALRGRALRTFGATTLPLIIFFAAVGVAIACVAPAEPTSLSTSLSGEGKSGEEITVLEGAKVKDQATLSGKNTAKATGKISYAVYADAECKELVTKAGEFEFIEGKVPASEEKTLEAGRVYYWQASYGGDSLNAPSTSPCGKEVLTVRAATSLSTSLSGEGKSGEEITVLEGAKVKDTATLSGTKSSTATGKVKYRVYADAKCTELIANAGEVTVSGGSVPASEEKTLEAGRVYYWQASYEGDSLHQPSTSPCGKEVLTVKAATSLSTTLFGWGKEGLEISVPAGSPVVDTATLGGTRSSTATGKANYRVYADPECKELVTNAGEVDVSGGKVPESEEKELAAGATYYWQVSYGGDELHQATVSPCDESVNVVAKTVITTSLEGEGREGQPNEDEEAIESELTVAEGAPVTDTATLSGENAAEATGTVTYSIYADPECEELVTKAGEVSVEGANVPPSTEVPLEPGVYFWQASYSGDANNYAAVGACGAEIAVVTPRITTTLSAGEISEAELEVVEGTAVEDEATLHGEDASEATGTVEYAVYSDPECKELVTKAGEVTVEGASVPPSTSQELEAGSYYWQAKYSGDEQNPPATSRCGETLVVVVTPTGLSTTLSGEGKEGSEITVEEGATVSDQATLSGANAEAAEGEVRYAVYSDSACEDLVALAGDVQVSEGEVPPSDELQLPVGTYYWLAEYTGDGLNQRVSDECGAEVLNVTWPITMTLSAGEAQGSEVEVVTETPASAKATLHGENASEATGTVEYAVYSDPECKELVTKAGEVTVEGASVPPSTSQELEAGSYYWQAKYSGDEQNPPATTNCGTTEQFVIDPASDKYAALGDSYSSGEGVARPDGFGNPPGQYYVNTDASLLQLLNPGPFMNRCHRSGSAWPGLVATAIYGGAVASAAEALRQQPPKFIFRACSGAFTLHVWRAGGGAPAEHGGQWDEAIVEPAARWWNGPKPGQALWLTLPGGLAQFGEPRAVNNAIKLVTLTIGGNDAGFGNVAAACIQWPWEPDFAYSPENCMNTIAGEEVTGFAAVENRLPHVLAAVRQAAPQARIRVPMYPRVVNWLHQGNIGVGVWGGRLLKLNNTVAGPGGGTAAVAVDGFAWRLNGKIAAVVAAWQAKNGGDVQVVPAVENALGGHQLGDPKPWINPVVLPDIFESFHPNACGHRSMALHVLPIVRGGVGPRPVLCK